MSETTKELGQEIRKSLDLLQALRGEVRVKLHLAGMEAKDEWRKLEPSLDDIERKAHEFTEATRDAASEAVKRIGKLLSSLR